MHLDMPTHRHTPSNVGAKRSSPQQFLKPEPETKAQTKKPKATQPPPKPQPVLFHKQINVGLGREVKTHSFGRRPISVYQSLHSRTNSIPSEAPISLASSIHTQENAAKDRAKFDVLQLPATPNSRPTSKRQKDDGHTYNLEGFAANRALLALIERYSSISHMGMLDPSYTFFLNQKRTGVLCYKVKDKIAVVGGDPLCAQSQWSDLLEEFAKFRKQHGLGIVFLGTSSRFVEYATENNWISMRWGTERALNPMTNKVLGETQSKRVVKQVKQLTREGTSIHIYVPSIEEDRDLELQLVNVYEVWRNTRNDSGKAQVYMTVFDPFALPSIMIYIYTSDVKGKINGFAALRKLANGYHIDPYCALPDAPRGVSELLIYAAMAILNHADVSYLGLGFEPADEMTEITGMSSIMENLTRAGYRQVFSRLPVSGKKAFHDKWYPDEQYDQGVYIVYPDGQPGIRHNLAMMHFNNISARKLLELELKEWVRRRKEKKSQQKQEKQEKTGLELTKTKSLGKSTEQLVSIRSVSTTESLPPLPCATCPKKKKQPQMCNCKNMNTIEEREAPIIAT